MGFHCRPSTLIKLGSALSKETDVICVSESEKEEISAGLLLAHFLSSKPPRDSKEISSCCRSMAEATEL